MITMLMEQTRRCYSLLFLLISLFFLLGCSKKNDEPEQVIGPDVDTRLLGTWKGVFNNNNNVKLNDITMTLILDGTTSLEFDNNSMTCSITGTWTVIDNRFKASYYNGCSRSTLILFAPSTEDSLTGDWDSSTPAPDNQSGTFSIGKQ